MKKQIITLLLVISTGIAFGQKKTEKSDYYLRDNYSQISEFKNGFEWVATVIKDTMVIDAPKVKFIKIDGVLFEIIRKTELKMYEPFLWNGIQLGGTLIERSTIGQPTYK
jgi:hypothetical protein